MNKRMKWIFLFFGSAVSCTFESIFHRKNRLHYNLWHLCDFVGKRKTKKKNCVLRPAVFLCSLFYWVPRRQSFGMRKCVILRQTKKIMESLLWTNESSLWQNNNNNEKKEKKLCSKATQWKVEKNTKTNIWTSCYTCFNHIFKLSFYSSNAVVRTVFAFYYDYYLFFSFHFLCTTK